MKLAPLVLALGSVRGDDGFQRWLDTHGANTRSTATLDVRRANYLSNQKLVDEHNAAADAGEHSFWLTTEGPLADLSLDEYRATLLSFGGGGVAGGAAAPAASAAAPPPDAFDWRDVPHVVGQVKNQLACGSCWAFSAVATMEGAWNYKTNSSNVFSEQQILDCEIGPKACDGGFMYKAVEFVSTQGGIEPEKDYKYSVCRRRRHGRAALSRSRGCRSARMATITS